MGNPQLSPDKIIAITDFLIEFTYSIKKSVIIFIKLKIRDNYSIKTISLYHKENFYWDIYEK